MACGVAWDMECARSMGVRSWPSCEPVASRVWGVVHRALSMKYGVWSMKH
jgi:hypothetical protein